MPEESEDEIGTPAEASKAAIDPGAEIADVGGQSIAQVLLDIAMAPLLGIQSRGIGGSQCTSISGCASKILFDHQSRDGR